MTISTTQIQTPDGLCTTEVVVPPGSGPWPAVIVFFDAGGLRPAQTRIAERIASDGYLVLQPDLFHRSPPLATFLGGPVTLSAMGKVFQDPDLRAKFMAGYYLPALNYANLGKTIGAVLDHIAARPDFKGRVGTTGYCMGGNASVRTATVFWRPDRGDCGVPSGRPRHRSARQSAHARQDNQVNSLSRSGHRRPAAGSRNETARRTRIGPCSLRDRAIRRQAWLRGR